jgi:hypothetical protein
MPEAKSTKTRSRIVGLRRVLISDLREHPLNPRVHGEEQASVMRSLLEEIGYASAIVAYESAEFGGLTLIDGHLRRELLGGSELDVLVVDLTDAEARLLLASHDKAGDMAVGDDAIMSQLLASIEIPKDLSLLFADIAAEIETQAETGGGLAENPPMYRLAPNVDEGYDYAVILCRRQTEFAQLATLLELPTREYKSGRVGMCRVIEYGEFVEKWNARK